MKHHSPPRFSSLSFLPSASPLAQRPTTLGKSSMVNAIVMRARIIQRQTALRKGDTLTIVVGESMQGQYAASTTTDKSVSASNDHVEHPPRRRALEIGPRQRPRRRHRRSG